MIQTMFGLLFGRVDAFMNFNRNIESFVNFRAFIIHRYILCILAVYILEIEILLLQVNTNILLM